MAIPETEKLLREPLTLPAEARKLRDRLRRSEDPCGLLVPGSVPSAALPSKRPGKESIPRTLERIVDSMSMARGSVAKAVASLTPDERRAALQEVRGIVTNETGPRSDPAVYDAIAGFDHAAMTSAGRTLCRAVWQELPVLLKAAGKKGLKEKRWKLTFGDGLLVGPGDRIFRPEELKDVALLIHLGGRSVYQGPVAAAGEGEVKVVIDLAAEVTVEAAADASAAGAPPNAGSGIFGIGLLFLPNAAGAKRITAGDFSLGAGLFGVGGIFIEGAGNELQGGRFTQGAGAFGAGLLWSRGERASFKADLSGQGYGFTRGLGIFSHQGSKADLRCGLRYPDPREASAALSLCQGAGYGHRAFAGGGIGLAYLEGNDSSLTTNYFGQGSGYWHGIGALFTKGNRNRLKARRYSQGSGIHTAVGILSVEGDANALVNWGVGPAFGWDYGVGYWLLAGDDNTSRADWGTGRGDVNGHGLAVIRGDRNKLLLPDFGTGFYKRAAPGYGLAAFSGKDNSLGLPALSSGPAAVKSLALGSWGTVVAPDGLILDPKLSLPATEWPPLDRTAAVEKERAELGVLLEAALKKTGRERIASLLHVTSSFSLDSQVPRLALREFFRTRAEDLPHLLDALSPDRFDEYLWLRVLLAGFGPEVSAWAARRFDASQGTYRALVAHCFRYSSIEQALPLLTRALADDDWAVRREAAGGIGYLFSREQGDEPGRLRFYEVMTSSQASTEETIKLFGWKRAVDVMAGLSLSGPVTPEERARLVDSFPGPNEPLPKEALSLFLEFSVSRADRKARLRTELSAAERARDAAAELLAGRASDPDPDVAAAALGSLGALGRPENAAILASFLAKKDAKRRDAAASGLARMGPPAREAVAGALSSMDRTVKTAACKASAQSWDAGIVALLGRCLEDRDPEVRAAGCAAMSAVQGALSESKKQFRDMLMKLSSSDPSSSVRAAAACAASQIPK
ncbi:MAG: HEAT repeat domain-containing protein [Elusimicrobia bacterium]|nr:HEAT repeat domain-containing protein [Elusimicrobiota bacterium]